MLSIPLFKFLSSKFYSLILYLHSLYPITSISDSSHIPLLLIHIHDSNDVGIYHVSPSIEHLAHALGCCTVDKADDAFLTTIATVQGPWVIPRDVRESHKLSTHPAYIEAQRVLSQAKPSAQESSDATH